MKSNYKYTDKPHKVASYFGVSVPTVRTWSDHYDLDYRNTPSGQRRYSLEQIKEQFANNHQDIQRTNDALIKKLSEENEKLKFQLNQIKEILL